MLQKNKLQNLLTDNYSNIQERGGTKLESAQGMADAIVSYAEDAELPVAPLSKVKTARVGQVALQSAIFASFSSGDPTMSPITPAIVAYVVSSFTIFSNTPPTNIGTGVCVMTIPPILAPVTALGMTGASQADVTKLTANIIHASFKSILFSGGLVLGGTPVPAGLVSVPLL